MLHFHGLVMVSVYGDYISFPDFSYLTEIGLLSTFIFIRPFKIIVFRDLICYYIILDQKFEFFSFFLGLFILGNMELLSYNSELWSTVHRVLQNNGSVGHFIPLSCKRHPESYMAVFQPNDLLTYSERGCEQICSYKLSCGHSCIRRCHSDDALHLKYR